MFHAPLFQSTEIEDTRKLITQKFLKYKKIFYCSSSLKFCRLAENSAQIYIRVNRIKKWDIAAGHAILKNASGIITDLQGNEILYGKKDFKNPSLVIKSARLLNNE